MSIVGSFRASPWNPTSSPRTPPSCWTISPQCTRSNSPPTWWPGAFPALPCRSQAFTRCLARWAPGQATPWWECNNGLDSGRLGSPQTSPTHYGCSSSTGSSPNRYSDLLDRLDMTENDLQRIDPLWTSGFLYVHTCWSYVISLDAEKKMKPLIW